MEKKLYVGNLSYETTEEELKELFSKYGTVESASIITDKRSGYSKGFGFVEMSTPEEAKKAMDALNGTEIGGRTIKIDEAKPMRERPNKF